jgi:MazG family protein
MPSQRKTRSRSTSLGPSRKSPSAQKSAVKQKSLALTPGEWFEKLVAVQKRLRAPNGCPWDREQTHASLRTYLIEEAYEVLDALDSGDDAKFAEEMGDLLLQVIFHSEIARERGRFTVADFIREVDDKKIRRHPHVFGTVHASNTRQVLKNWESIKAQERAAKIPEPANGAANSAKEKHGSLLDGVSRNLPAVLEGLQLTRKAARAGFDWHNADGIFEKLREEMAEVRHALNEKQSHKAEEELGDLLFAAVNLARFLQIDPEIALKKANTKFQRRFLEMEKSALARGRAFVDLPREEMESLWDTVKRNEVKKSAAAKSESARSASSTSR